MFNDNVEERYALAIERIKEIAEEPGLKTDGFADYFKCIATFILKMDKLAADLKADVFRDYSLEEYKNLNTGLYEDVIGKAYETSYANPAYAASKLGLSEGRLLSFLYVEIRGMIVYAYEGRMAEMTALMELFVEVYCMCASTEEDCGKPDYKQMKDSVYWYVSDYSDDLMEYRVRELLDPELDFATKIIMESDLTDVRYLYRFGEYVTDNEIKTAEYLSSLSEEEIQKMADTFTEGYRIGFELTGKDLSKKKTVNIRYCLGFERLVRAEIKNFEKLGLKPTIYRAAVNTINKRLNIKVGYYGANPNKQMDFDHRFDNALYMDGEFVERKTGALKLAYEKNKEDVPGYAAALRIIGACVKAETIEQLPDEVMDEFFTIEGVQERVYESIVILEAVLDEIRVGKAEQIESLALTETFDRLDKVSKLLSTSLFIDLDKVSRKTETADHAYITAKKEALVKELGDLFSSVKRPVYRSMMCKLLAAMPIFMNTQQEIRDYFDYVIENCKDDSELMACNKLISEMIEE